MKPGNCLAKEKRGKKRGEVGGGGEREKAIGKIGKAQLCPFSKL